MKIFFTVYEVSSQHHNNDCLHMLIYFKLLIVKWL